MPATADHPFFAAVYDTVLAPVEHAGLAERRRRLLARARGAVLEVGGGTGHNLAHYRGRHQGGMVTAVDVLEPDGAMRRRLEPRAAAASVPVRVLPIGVDDPLPRPAYDTIVCTLVLCTVPDLDRAVATLGRALAPEGELLFLEHVQAPGWRGRAQHRLSPVWSKVAAGCHLDRDPVGALRAGGLAVTTCERFTLPRAHGAVRDAAQGVAVHRVRPAMPTADGGPT